jgi:hypothetical protein
VRSTGAESCASLPTVGRVDIDVALGSRDTAWLVSSTEEGCVSIRDLMTIHTPTARRGETILGATRLIDAAHGKVLLARDRLMGVLDWDVISDRRNERLGRRQSGRRPVIRQ